MLRSQFSLRTMLATVAVVGIGAALWVAEPSWQVGAVEFLLVPCVLASTAIISVHSTGRAKAFWFGFAAECAWPLVVYLPVAVGFSLPDAIIRDNAAVPPYLEVLGWFPIILVGISGDFRPVLLAWAFAPLVGLLCVFTHWLLIRPAEGPQD